MVSSYYDIAHQYFDGTFKYKSDSADYLDSSQFSAKDKVFHQYYDDWYRAHYARYGGKVDAVKALVILAITAFRETYGHMPLCYKNCAISSGTNPHLDAVMRDHHTSDKLARVIGSEKHTWHNIVDNSLRSLARAHKVQPLYPGMYMVTPSAFEGTTRVFSKGSGRKLTGGLPFDGADYMSFWNMVIDSCAGFILDDVRLDMPAVDRVVKEIELAQAGSAEKRDRLPIHTSDWANSRNSVLEMARGNYIRFGLHPLRPDGVMDMRLYDEETHSLYPATLLDCVKPVVQNILRWTPQGIATEEACRTVARLFNIHRMRTDPAYNARQEVPLALDSLAPLIRDPKQSEIHEFSRLIDKIEPFLLEYCPHLIRPEGLPEDYARAQKKAALRPGDIGQNSVAWQRRNIPVKTAAELWSYTLPAARKPDEAFEKRGPLHGAYRPQRRQHDFNDAPFKPRPADEIWIDHPYENLDEMMQDLARVTVGVLETGLLPHDSPDYRGVRFDMKRGERGVAAAQAHRVHDLSLLPGAMGRHFKGSVGEPNLKHAKQIAEDQRHDDKGLPVAVFGAPQVKIINDAIRSLRPMLAGPGPAGPSSDFRLAIEMEMLRRSYTHITFQNGWEASEDSARMMLQATKIEFGKITRPAGNDTEITVLDEEGRTISLFRRYDALRACLDRLHSDPEIKKYIAERDSDTLEQMGVRHVSLTLARMIELYDGLVDPMFNGGRFELQKVQNQGEFTRGLHDIQATKAKTQADLMKNWVWLWSDRDFTGLKQEYRDAWLNAHGDMARRAGPAVSDDHGITYRYGG